MFAAPITTVEDMATYASFSYPFLEEGESYHPPEQTTRNLVVSRAINALRDELAPLSKELAPLMVVVATPTNVTDIINNGLCHTFATLVRGYLSLVGVALNVEGDPFHVWLYDPVENIHYDAHFTLGTRYREDLDGGYSPVNSLGWTQARLREEYHQYNDYLTKVCALIKKHNPESPFLAAEYLEF